MIAAGGPGSWASAGQKSGVWERKGTPRNALGSRLWGIGGVPIIRPPMAAADVAETLHARAQDAAVWPRTDAERRRKSGLICVWRHRRNKRTAGAVKMQQTLSFVEWSTPGATMSTVPGSLSSATSTPDMECGPGKA